ncbi:hypothetical protein SAMN03097699_2686 [Flavobacteriaceae bacterium MAR_2010_188]|nr:hypothetical protein SAMN03097699_2686 [Flavobacteriaceae bacterium MAR_2010_188]
MLSRFFSKSQPIHYVVVGLILLVVFSVSRLSKITEPFTLTLLIKQLILFGLCLFTIFLFDFLTAKNKLTRKNSYDILLFSLFVALLPETILNSNILLAHLFVLLAIRRIISLRSKREMKKKLLDASFWVGIATLFYFWASLYFVLIFIGLIFFAVADLKNWIIPFIGVLCVFIISLAYLMITNHDYIQFYKDMFDYSFDFTNLNSMGLIIGITLLLSYGNWALFFFIKQLKSKKKSYRPAFVIIIFAEIIALLIVALAPDKNGSEFIFLFTPLAIIMTNYLENLEERWFRELLIWVLVITPFATSVL